MEMTLPDKIASCFAAFIAFACLQAGRDSFHPLQTCMRFFVRSVRRMLETCCFTSPAALREASARCLGQCKRGLAASVTSGPAPAVRRSGRPQGRGLMPEALFGATCSFPQKFPGKPGIWRRELKNQMCRTRPPGCWHWVGSSMGTLQFGLSCFPELGRGACRA